MRWMLWMFGPECGPGVNTWFITAAPRAPARCQHLSRPPRWPHGVQANVPWPGHGDILLTREITMYLVKIGYQTMHWYMLCKEILEDEWVVMLQYRATTIQIILTRGLACLTGFNFGISNVMYYRFMGAQEHAQDWKVSGSPHSQLSGEIINIQQIWNDFTQENLHRISAIPRTGENKNKKYLLNSLNGSSWGPCEAQSWGKVLTCKVENLTFEIQFCSFIL